MPDEKVIPLLDRGVVLGQNPNSPRLADLLPYVNHKQDCAVIARHGGYHCSCGLDRWFRV